MKIGIAVSDTYPEITHKMLEHAKSKAKELGVETVTLHADGSLDLPFIAKQLLEKEDVDGVATLGAIIEGQTDHDKIIGYGITKAFIDLSLQYNKPVTCGVSGPKMTRDQAIARIESMATKSVEACINLIKTKTK